jgi:hypothetical protein
MPPFGCGAGSGACNEPVCCGVGCFGNNVCGAAAYPAPGTRISFNGAGCGALDATSQTGVLCCED